MRDNLRISEPVVAPDRFVTELSMIEHFGSCVRLVFTARLFDCDQYERRVVARLVVPAELLKAICRQIQGEEKAPFPAIVTGGHDRSGFDA
jgi:hypothetical protein